IAHPINSACREVIQSAVLKAFSHEKERSKQPGYVCTYDDFDSDYDGPAPASYSQVVSELGAVPRGYRTHGAHAAAARNRHAAPPRPRPPPRAGGNAAGAGGHGGEEGRQLRRRHPVRGPQRMASRGGERPEGPSGRSRPRLASQRLL